MSRRPIVVGNWKMYKTVPEAVAFAIEWRSQLDRHPGVEIGFAPPALAVAPLAERFKGTGVIVAGQNLHWEDQGAFTGELSAPMLAAAGARAVLVGHSERRQYFGETDETVSRKVVAALRAELVPIVCVGETLEQRRRGATFDVVDRQVEAAFSNVPTDSIARCVIAYEPVWAIGTGETATKEQAQEVHARIRDVIRARAGRPVADAVRIQYGGSVKPANAAELLAQPDVDGALVGGASLEVASFAAICSAVR